MGMKLINVYRVLSFLDEVYITTECSYLWVLAFVEVLKKGLLQQKGTRVFSKEWNSLVFIEMLLIAEDIKALTKLVALLLKCNHFLNKLEGK